jgi:ferrochelatase
MSSLSRTGVLLLQLGTPDAPTPAALRRYLAEFLVDRRAIDLPRALWLPILYLRVLPTRPAKSAKLYKKVWTKDGSPLLVTSERQACAVADRLEQQFPGEISVAVGMRYGNPSIAAAVGTLLEAGCDRLLAVPMYPQYAGATIGSSLEKLFNILGRMRVVPPVRVVPPYFDDGAYIEALRTSATAALGDWVPDHVVISFHGLPKRYATAGDPYPDHCRRTAELLIARMGWSADRVTLSFQSLFGGEEWLRPYTDETLVALAKRGTGKLAVLCPGFTADCLETIEEMGMTNRKVYEAAGGAEYRLLPCLNVDPVWIDALTGLVRRELQGWTGGTAPLTT